MVLAVRVRLPVISRPVAVPVTAKLVIKGTMSASRLWLARRMVTRLAAELPGYPLREDQDDCYHREIAGVPAGNPHALRHTFGTILAEADVGLAVMQATTRRRRKP